MTSPNNIDTIEDDQPDPNAHLWPTVPNPGTDWMDRAKCVTTPPPAGRDPFDLTGIPNKSRHAARLCFRCPVMRECAKHALYIGEDAGVVRAGTWIPAHAYEIHKLPAAIARLERIAGTGQAAA